MARRQNVLDDAMPSALLDATATVLDISGAEGVTDSGLRAVAERCGNVCAADVTGCTGITSAGLRVLAAAAPSMHTLRCGGAARCDSAARAALLDSLPRLHSTAANDEPSWM